MATNRRRSTRTECDSRTDTPKRLIWLLAGLLCSLEPGRIRPTSSAIAVPDTAGTESHRIKANLLQTAHEGFKVHAKVRFWDEDTQRLNAQFEFTETYSLDEGRALIEIQKTTKANSTSDLKRRKYYVQAGELQVIRVDGYEPSRTAKSRCEQIQRREMFENLFEPLAEASRDIMTELWLRPFGGDTSAQNQQIAAQPDFVVGLARLLLYVDSNRDSMKATVEQKVREQTSLRYNLPLATITTRRATERTSAKLKLQTAIYFAKQNFLTWANSELPLRIWIKSSGGALVMIDYNLVEPLRASLTKAPIEGADYQLSQTTIQLGLKCSSLLKQPSQQLSPFLEVYSMQFEVLDVRGDRSLYSRNDSRMETSTGVEVPPRREFIAFDGKQMAFRRDIHDQSSRAHSTTIYDLKRDLKFNFKHTFDSARPPNDQGPIEINDHAERRADCIVSATSLGVFKWFAPFDDLVRMGSGQVRGVEVELYEHVSSWAPALFFYPSRFLNARGDWQSHSETLAGELDSELVAAGETPSFSNIYYFAASTMSQVDNVKVPNTPQSLGQLLRVDVMRDGRILKQINVFDSEWQLSDAPAIGDCQEVPFAVPCSCYAQRARHSLTSSMNLEMEFQTALSGNFSVAHARQLFESGPVRNKALVRALASQSHFSATQLLDITSTLIMRSSKDPRDDKNNSFKIQANIKMVLNELGDLYQPEEAARVHLHAGQKPFADGEATSFDECFFEAARLQHLAGVGPRVLFAFINEACYIDPVPLFEVEHDEKGQDQIKFTYSSVFRIIRQDMKSPWRAMQIGVVPSQDLTRPSQIAGRIYESLTGKQVTVSCADSTKSPQGGSKLSLEAFLFKVNSLEFVNDRDDGALAEQDNLLNGLTFANGRKLQSLPEDSQMVTVDFQTCQAACTLDLNCNSFSVCTRGHSVECSISELNFNKSLLDKLAIEIKSSDKDRKSRRVSFEFANSEDQDRPQSNNEEDEEKDSAPSGNSAQKAETKTQMVELLKDKRCQIYRKQTLDLFREESSRSLTLLRRKYLFEVDNEKECAEICLKRNVDYFKSHREFDLDKLAKSNSTEEQGDHLSKIRKRHFSSLRSWCSSFKYLNVKTSMAAQQLMAKSQSKELPKKDGICLLARPRAGQLRSASSQASNSTKSNDDKDESKVRLEMETFKFLHVSLYEMRRDILMLAYPNEEERLPTAKHHQEPFVNRCKVAEMKSPEDCARACFMQTIEVRPYCKSFGFVELRQPGSTNKSTFCSFNSMSLKDARQTGDYDSIVTVNKDLLTTVRHYEPREAYLISDDLMKRLAAFESNDKFDEQSHQNKGALAATCLICLTALVSGLVLGYTMKEPLVKRWTDSRSQDSDSIPRQRFSNGKHKDEC